MKNRLYVLLVGSFALAVLVFLPRARGAEVPKNLEPKNLVAWCIVPFDASKRSPSERAKMLAELGIGRCAYDWRQEHVKEFEEEILQYKKHGIEYFAFWAVHDEANRLFKKHGLHPQIWQTLGSPSEGTQDGKVEAAAKAMEASAGQAAKVGCKLGLYNHGGWGGEPQNLVAVCKKLHEKGHKNVGIVYNWHHGHGHIKDWAESLKLMKPWLLCLNLNGMNTGAQPKILPLAQGEHELAMLKTVVKSGYTGPIGILDHQGHLDTEEVLRDNLAGLEWLRKELEKPGSGGAKPVPKAKPPSKPPPPVPKAKAKAKPASVPSLNKSFANALSGGLLLEGKDAWRNPPITVECRAKLRNAGGYNILVASDTKASMAHWEIFSMNGDGTLTVYLPGATPDHIRSKKVITDDRWHAIAMQYAPDRVRLFVDGVKVADQVIALKPNRRIVPGGIAFGRLVEGQFGSRGAIDEVRIRSKLFADVGHISDKPFKPGAPGEIGLWNFDDLKKYQALNTGAVPKANTLSYPREPLDPASNPHWQHPINRDRIYDYYAKQSLRYAKMAPEKIPEVLPAFPGIDGGSFGHWGNQNDVAPWKDGRVREMDHGSMVSGVFRGAGKTIPRAVSVSLGDGFNVVFDQASLTFAAAWKGDLVQWSDVRRGLMHGIPMGGGKVVPMIDHGKASAKGAKYLGLYRRDAGVAFAMLEGGEKKFRTAQVRDGKVVIMEVGAPKPGLVQWPERVRTRGELGQGRPYAIDTLTLPYENPWKALFFVSGVDFLPENRIAICNLHGDVWICDVVKSDLSELRWKRFAAGLHQPLGLVVFDGVIHVRCRDQIVALHDLNDDDEADFYECVSDVQATSAGGHDFITGLQRDAGGRWYFASGNQGLCRVSADGKTLEVLGTGLRNPNGVGISPDGTVILAAVQEGNWTPASAVCDISRGGHFGAGGPKKGERGYVPPMLYLPRGVDNSCGGQTYIESDRWGPARGQWLHFSSGLATHFLMLRESIGGESQAAAVPLWGEFLSGSHRGRFSPNDGQLYVASAQGWGNYGVKDGALQRVRYTGRGKAFPYPIAHETRDNGILLTFADPQSSEISDLRHWFAQQWNYRYGPAYGSLEYSVQHPDRPGHDRLEIRSVQRLGDGRRIFIEIPQLRPVNQLHLHCQLAGNRRIELFATLHRLGKAFTDFPGYQRIEKTWGGPGVVAIADSKDPAVLIQACATCHHPAKRVVGPSLGEIRLRYAGKPEEIVKWAMKPENKNPQLPPMPSFAFLGEDKLRVIADYILSGKSGAGH